MRFEDYLNKIKTLKIFKWLKRKFYYYQMI